MEKNIGEKEIMEILVLSGEDICNARYIRSIYEDNFRRLWLPDHIDELSEHEKEELHLRVVEDDLFL